MSRREWRYTLSIGARAASEVPLETLLYTITFPLTTAQTNHQIHVPCFCVHFLMHTLGRESLWNSILGKSRSWQNLTIWLKTPWPWQTAFSQGARKWYCTLGARQWWDSRTLVFSIYHATNTPFLLNTNYIIFPIFSLNVAFGCINKKKYSII